MGYRVHVLDPDPKCPCAPYADRFIEARYDDTEAALRLAEECDVLTLETEHIPADVLDEVAAKRPLHPSPDVLRTIQDRLAQRRFLEGLGAPQPRFAPVDSLESLQAALEEVGTPAILKSRRGGYDGKGQVRIQDPAEAADAWEAAGVPSVLEAFVPFDKEVSVVLARDHDGTVAAWPLAENVHQRGILHTTRIPADVPAGVPGEALGLATRIIEALDHVGVAAVEMFLHDGDLLINEIAPRTHNSGHVTFGGATTSQFEQHLRAVCGLPLGDPAMSRPVTMVNLLGDLWSDDGVPPDWTPALVEDAKLHLYGKAVARPGRKMGHVLVLGEDAKDVLLRAEQIHDALSPGP